MGAHRILPEKLSRQGGCYALSLACRHRLPPTGSHGRTRDLRPLFSCPARLRSPVPPDLHLAGARRVGLQTGPLPRPGLSGPCPHPQPPGRGPDYAPLVAHRLARLLLAGLPPLRPPLVRAAPPGGVVRQLPHQLVRPCHQRVTTPLPSERGP